MDSKDSINTGLYSQAATVGNKNNGQSAAFPRNPQGPRHPHPRPTLYVQPVLKLSRNTPERGSATFFERWSAVRALLADTAALSYGVENMFQNAPFQVKINNQKCCRHGCDFRAQNTPKCVCSRVTELPRPPSWFSGAASQQGRGGEREGRERGLKHSPTSFFTI